MTIHTKRNFPNIFYPHTAKKLGITAAVVEMAIIEMGYRGEEEPPRKITLCEVLERCWFLPEDDVYNAYKLFDKNNEDSGVSK